MFEPSIALRWWFQNIFFYIPTWGRFPVWLIFFRWVEITNHLSLVHEINKWFGSQWFGILGVLLSRDLFRIQTKRGPNPPTDHYIVHQQSNGKSLQNLSSPDGMTLMRWESVPESLEGLIFVADEFWFRLTQTDFCQMLLFSYYCYIYMIIYCFRRWFDMESYYPI